MSITVPPAAPLLLNAWRHHDEDAAQLPGIAMEPEVVAGHDLAAAAADLFARGARRVALPGVVDLSGGAPAGPAGGEEAAVRALVLVRELTSRGIVVDWRLRLAAAAGAAALNHLYPPAELDAPDRGRQLEEWAETYHICKCVYRRGPGFVQVRDRRSGELSRFTVDDPDYVAAIGVLSGGADPASVPAAVLAGFAAENLVWQVGRTAVWLPYRVHRWPWPSTRA